jgi:hypothetical protein
MGGRRRVASARLDDWRQPWPFVPAERARAFQVMAMSMTAMNEKLEQLLREDVAASV